MGRVRAAKSKVRTGCRTCKARRVKCDEAKPECKRCTSTNRECGGYEIIAPKPPSQGYPPKYILPGKPPARFLNIESANALSLPTSIPGASVDETNYFSFFCQYTAPTISGAFASQFFERFVLQLAVREPMIRHAATALGALQRAQERNGRVTLGQEEANFATRQYTKAINLALKKLLAPDLESQRLKLVACALFVCYEVAQKRFRETAMHLEQGMNILVNIRHNGELPPGWDTDTFDHSEDAASLDREIARTFDRLDIQSTYVRSTRPKLWADPMAVALRTPRKFSGIEQAREYLSVLTRSISTFRHEVRATPSPFNGEDEQLLLRLQLKIRSQVQAWFDAFGSLKLPQVPLPVGSPVPADVAARAVLEGTAICANILLETGVSDGSECIFDNFTSKFKEIVDLGQIAKDHPRKPASSGLPNGGSSFHIHMGTIPTVYIVALKCRDPIIRRRALRLLETFPFREGMWDAPMGASLCRHVMEVEEEGFHSLTCAQDLPEKARIHEAMFDITAWDGGIPVYYKRRDFEGEYGRPGAWLNWSGRANIARNCFEDETHWSCNERYHYIGFGTGRCLGCGQLAEEVQARGEEVGLTTCPWEQQPAAESAGSLPPMLQLEDEHGQRSSPKNSPFVDQTRLYYHWNSEPPGRGPAELLLRPRAHSNNSHHSFCSDDINFAAFDQGDLHYFAASLSNSPAQLQLPS